MAPRPNRSTTVFTFLLVASAAACGVSKPPKSKDAGAMDGGSTGGRSTGGTGATDAGGGGGSRGGGGSLGGGGTGGTGGTGGSASGGAAGTAGGRGGGNAGAGGIGGASPGGNGGGGSTGLLPLPVNLRTAANYVILAKSGISTVPPSVITGNLGVSPATATAITQFSLIADSTNVFWSSSQVTGKVYAADNAVPTPTNLTTAVNDMEVAFTEAAGRAPMVTELGAGTIGGMTLAPGVYKWGSGV
ncbi:MAG: ice-binding family protein, partial [Myxococcales bacterium]